MIYYQTQTDFKTSQGKARPGQAACINIYFNCKYKCEGTILAMTGRLADWRLRGRRCPWSSPAPGTGTGWSAGLSSSGGDSGGQAGTAGTSLAQRLHQPQSGLTQRTQWKICTSDKPPAGLSIDHRNPCKTWSQFIVSQEGY